MSVIWLQAGDYNCGGNYPQRSVHAPRDRHATRWEAA